jgi:hypothetical protein
MHAVTPPPLDKKRHGRFEPFRKSPIGEVEPFRLVGCPVRGQKIFSDVAAEPEET